MDSNDNDLAIYKPFRCEGGTNQASQSPELGLEGVSDAAFSGSHQELVPCSRVEGEESNVEGAVPTSGTAVVVRKEPIKDPEKQNLTSDSDSETDSLENLDTLTSPKHRFSRNLSNSTCTTASPLSPHDLSEYSASSDSEGVVDECNGRYTMSVQEQEKQRTPVHKKEGQGLPTQGNQQKTPIKNSTCRRHK